MKKTFLAVACGLVLACSGANALVVLKGNHYTAYVEPEFDAAVQLVGDAVVSDGSPETTWTGPIFSEKTVTIDLNDMVFVPDAGYTIGGLSVAYQLSFQYGTYKGFSSGSDFSSPTGPITHIAGSGGADVGTMTAGSLTVTHLVAGKSLSGQLILTSRIYDTLPGCLDIPMPGGLKCPAGTYDGWLPAELKLDSYTVTPTLVSNVPEPSTYALMAVGLAGLAAVSRRSSRGS